MNSENLKGTISSAAELKEELQTSIADAKQGKLQVGAVVRLIVMAIAWINQVAATFGAYDVPKISDSTVYVIATVITIVVTLYGYWKNNSWTLNAKTADAVLGVLRESGITTDELVDAVSDIIDKGDVEEVAAETEADNTTENEEGGEG